MSLTSNQDSKPVVPIYEYKTHTVQYIHEVERWANEYGHAGWRCVSLIWDENGRQFVLLVERLKP